MQSKSLGLQFVGEVFSAAEERALAPEWSRIYIHQEYPKVKYHWNGKTVTVVCLSAYRHTQIPKASPATRVRWPARRANIAVSLYVPI